jgi:hypothetical protein
LRTRYHEQKQPAYADWTQAYNTTGTNCEPKIETVKQTKREQTKQQKTQTQTERKKNRKRNKEITILPYI